MVERWDGLDELGKPVPPGKYTWKGLYHKPITTRFVLSVDNSGQPPTRLTTMTGGWGGDEGAPARRCAAGEDMLLGWSCAEAGYGIIRVNPDGKKNGASRRVPLA